MHKISAFFSNAYLWCLLLIGRFFFKLNRLEAIEMVDLRETIDKAIELFNDPISVEPDEDYPEAKQYIFQPSLFHEIVIVEWEGIIHSITYWSLYSSPNKDLAHMFARYGEGKKWTVLEEGYFYIREDNDRMLWCSAMPAIGVGTIKFRDVKTAYKNSMQTEQDD